MSLAVDWNRVPTSDTEESLCSQAVEASLEFLRSMESVRPLYESDEDIRRYRDVAAPIILAAVDAHTSRVDAIAEPIESAIEWLREHDSDWGLVTSILNAIAAVGLFQFEMIDHPSGKFACRYRLSGQLLEMVQGAEAPASSTAAAADAQPSEPAEVDLDHSRQLDVHTWSDHPEVNSFVDAIYAEHFPPGWNLRITKTHLKVILLDLYVAWSQDPDLKIAYSRNDRDYKRWRYNALHISKRTPKIVDRLIEVGLVHHKLGYLDRGTGIGRVSRMWPTEALIEKFQDARFGPLDIGGYENRECIILREKEGKKSKEIEYDDTPETNRMREVLQAYNELLRDTFIDVPTLNEPLINVESDSFRKASKLHINQRDKFVRRIFSRGSFNKGGRFYGGWWQRCPQEWRAQIFIDDTATSEIDYSGLHIVMLYAQRGTNYWEELGEDPYLIDIPEFLESQQETRAVAKQLLLMAINARNDKAAFKAFRDDAETGSKAKRLNNAQLGPMLNALREKHPTIADQFASDSGIDLMNLDAKITERIIWHYTLQDIPILTIHDSYVVPYGLESDLEAQMAEAFEAVMGVSGVKAKNESFQPEAWEPLDEESAMGMDMTAWETDMRYRFDPPRSDRYARQMAQFNEWKSQHQKLRD